MYLIGIILVARPTLTIIAAASLVGAWLWLI